MNGNDHYEDDPRADKAYRVSYLVARFIRGTLTEEEREELDQWILESEDNLRLFTHLTDEQVIADGLQKRQQFRSRKAIRKLRKKLGHPVRSLYRQILPYAAVACLMLAGGLFFLNRNNTREVLTPVIAGAPDVQPGTDLATLTLSDGRVIRLDTTNATISEGDITLQNLHRRLQYNEGGNATTSHLLSTPKGGRYSLVLSDGTVVWLNAATSLKYPAVFSGGERRVVLNGEAYFEVAKDHSKKFIVETGDLTTEVLGTHFNISSYEDEVNTAVTLLEGSVQVTKVAGGRSSVKLIPGQQAAYDNGSITIHNSPDTNQVIAWKNDFFEFKDASIETIMRQVTRWYDVDVVYAGKVTSHFNASISRNIPVSTLFRYLQLTGRVNFEIKDRTIIVKP